jgi:hypothetical protein
MRSKLEIIVGVLAVLGLASSGFALTPAGDETRELLEQVAAGNLSATAERFDASTATPENLIKGLQAVLDELGPQPASREYFTENTSALVMSSGLKKDWGVLRVEQGTDSFIVRYEIIEKEGKRQFRTFRVEKVTPEAKELSKFDLTGRSIGSYGLLLVGSFNIVFCIATAVLAFRTAQRKRWLWTIFCLLGVVQLNFVWAPAEFLSLPLPISYKLLQFQLLGFGFLKQGFYAPYNISVSLPAWAIFYRWRLSKRQPAQNFGETVS